MIFEIIVFGTIAALITNKIKKANTRNEQKLNELKKWSERYNNYNTQNRTESLRTSENQDGIWNAYLANKQALKEAKTDNPSEWSVKFLKELEWKRFEIVCNEYLKLQNHNAHLTNIGADGGIDIRIADENGKTTAIAQCKAYNSAIKVNFIREFYGVMNHENVETGFFLTTSYFTKDAKEFAYNKKIHLITGQEIVNFLNKLEPENKKRLIALATEGDYKTPTCPRCDIKLIRRKGRNGQEFYGCKNYPLCRTTIRIRNNQNNQ